MGPPADRYAANGRSQSRGRPSMLADQALTETPIVVPRSVVDRSMLVFEYTTAVIAIVAVALLAVLH
jgi:hypothetical protein